jgi:hypothetical protein
MSRTLSILLDAAVCIMIGAGIGILLVIVVLI